MSDLDQIFQFSAFFFSTEGKNEKSKDTLLSSTFKVGENKVPLLFLIFGLCDEIWPFFKVLLQDLKVEKKNTLIWQLV